MQRDRRLYEVDSFCREFSSQVLSCEASSRKDGTFYEIVLEDTAFYPEGGGQPFDVGYLNAVEIVAVHEKDGKVLHLACEPIAVGTEVQGRIDWQRRFQLMQAHSGEHILSGFAHSLYGCENVGFHMGKDFVTIDFDVLLTWEQAEEIERKANEYIWENHAIEVSYPTPEQLQSLAYRSKKELSGDVRVVRFPHADCCACCGTHVESSGQVGLVKLFSCSKFRQGVRIELLCGERALQYLSELQQENQKVSALLSAKAKETSVAVASLLQERDGLRNRVQQLEKLQVAQLLQQHQGEMLVFVEDISLDALRVLSTDLGKALSEQGICACFLKDGEGYRYSLSSVTGDVRPVAKALNEAFSGRGGGKPTLAQGSVRGTPKDLRDFVGKLLQGQ